MKFYPILFIFLFVLLISILIYDKIKIDNTVIMPAALALTTQQQINNLNASVSKINAENATIRTQIDSLNKQIAFMDARTFPYDPITKTIYLSRVLSIDTIFAPNGLFISKNAK